MGSIWIESYEIARTVGLANHYYLVYRPETELLYPYEDTQSPNQDALYDNWKIIRGGPQNPGTDPGKLQGTYDSRFPLLADTIGDRYGEYTTPNSRDAELIDFNALGISPELAWSYMSSYAAMIDMKYPYLAVDSLVNYTTNSSSFLASVLNVVGVNIVDYLDGAVGTTLLPEEASPGSQNLLGSAGNEELTGDHRDNSFFDVGGTDTFIGGMSSDVIYDTTDGTDFASYQYHQNPSSLTVRPVYYSGQTYWSVGGDRLYSIEMVEIGGDYSHGGIYIDVTQNIYQSGPTFSLQNKGTSKNP